MSRNSCIWAIAGLIDVKRKENESNKYWLHALVPWPHQWPWPWDFKVKLKNSFISGMGRPTYMVRKGCEPSIYDQDVDLCAAMPAWMDVPYIRIVTGVTSDVDISSLYYDILMITYLHSYALIKMHSYRLPIAFRWVSYISRQNTDQNTRILPWIVLYWICEGNKRNWINPQLASSPLKDVK